MKNYKEQKYTLGNGTNGKAEWQNPETTRELVSMPEKHAEDLNSQFPSTGIKYELLDEQPEFAVASPKQIVTDEELKAENNSLKAEISSLNEKVKEEATNADDLYQKNDELLKRAVEKDLLIVDKQTEIDELKAEIEKIKSAAGENKESVVVKDAPPLDQTVGQQI